MNKGRCQNWLQTSVQVVSRIYRLGSNVGNVYNQVDAKIGQAYRIANKIVQEKGKKKLCEGGEEKIKKVRKQKMKEKDVERKKERERKKK